jgi:hypothetical protein
MTHVHEIFAACCWSGDSARVRELLDAGTNIEVKGKVSEANLSSSFC